MTSPAKRGSGNLPSKSRAESSTASKTSDDVISTRLFVKNLPKHATDATIRKHFSRQGGEVTDAKVLTDDDGKSKRAAFIGFRTPEEALQAKKFFDRTFMDTSRISVEIAKPLGDPSLRRFAKKKDTRESEPKVEASESKQKKSSSDKAKVVPKGAKHEEFLKLMKSKKAEGFWSDEEEERGVSIDEESDERPTAQGDDVAKDTTDVESSTKPTNRLFIRNLPYSCTKGDLETVFEPYGVTDIVLPVDATQRIKGYGIVTFSSVGHSTAALKALDGKPFQGRLLHIIHAEPERTARAGASSDSKVQHGSDNYKTKKEEERRKNAGSKDDQKTWHSLFVRADAAAGAVAKQLGISKRELILGGGDDEDDVAIRVAMSEAKVVNEGKAFLESEGIDLDVLESALRGEAVTHSDTVLIAKNLPENAVEADLKSLFAKLGTLERFVMPPSRTMALISFHEPVAAKKAMNTLAYTRYKNAPLYLQFAPEKILGSGGGKAKAAEEVGPAGKVDEVVQEEEVSPGQRVLFIKNLEFSVTEPELSSHIMAICKFTAQHITIPKKRGKKGEELSSGYGFVQFADEESAQTALTKLHGTALKGHTLDVKVSSSVQGPRTASATSARSTPAAAVPASGSLPTKIVVRNLAFEATKKDVRKLFAAHAEVKSVRLPKKMDGTIRGFAFVEFTTHQQAKNALAALGAAHLYGRRLVAEFTSNTEEEDDEEEAVQARKRMRGGE